MTGSFVENASLGLLTGIREIRANRQVGLNLASMPDSRIVDLDTVSPRCTADHSV
ncbi:hypothetical protein [Amycolatopsis sp. Hca4]|uniref:hypothetical protein n=1 Tax=Amycolatopsis sp. Hca4 TaxID=2742131 RepID=UPI0015906217|nr:hypothetical protein [Amycolatopsis sp. Hca4]QKV80626.1 hypothetical protein HUT10_47765 [Amycolatopsis sp. Hca4]